MSQVTKNNNLATFPGNLTNKQTQKYYKSKVTSKEGTLIQERQYLQCTEIINHNNGPPQPPLGDDITPRCLNTRTDTMYVSCIQCIGKIYGNPAVKFITPSFSGNNYILIVHNYDINSIYAKSLVNRTKEYQLLVYQEILLLLKNHG